MYSYTIVPVAALICYLFLLMSFLAAKKNAMVRTFMWLLLLMVGWTAGSMFMRMRLYPSVNFWFQVSLTGLMLFPCVFFLFLRTFVEDEQRYHLHFWLGSTVLAIAVNWRTGLLVKAPVYVMNGEGGAFSYEMTWNVIILFLLAAGPIMESARMLYNNRDKNIFLWKRLRPIWYGIGIMMAGHLCLLLPVFDTFPVDMLAGIPLAICLYYAIYKKQVFEMRLLISKTNCSIAVFLVTVIIFYQVIPGYEKYLVQRMRMDDSQVMLVVSFSMVLAGVFLYILLEKFLDVVFESEEARFAKAIREISSRMSHLMSVEEMLAAFTKVVQSVIPVDKIYFYLKNETGDYELVRSREKEKVWEIAQTHLFFKVLADGDGRILISDFRDTAAYKKLPEDECQKLRECRMECIIAAREEDQCRGLLLLPEKGNGRPYTRIELDFLSSIGNMVLIAINNSRLYETAYWEARRDSLTGVANRKYFYEKMKECCEERRYGKASLLIINLDDFKLYNQIYGTEEGDAALKRAADIIQKNVEDRCFVARYGGKEFVVMLPNYSGEEARKTAEQLSEEIRSMNLGFGENAMKILTASCGIAEADCRTSDYHELIEHAEMAVFFAKQAGKNRIVVYAEGEKSMALEAATEWQYRQSREMNYMSTIYALMAAIDAKDHYTFSHSENVAYYASELARAYGLSHELQQVVYKAGLLHDVGKVGIDETILNKPGKLTSEEYEVIKTHVELSIGIIRHLPSLDYVIPAVLGHHERYDGNGYPRGMKGEEIPLAARMLCIADSFDAMVSKRSYKLPMEINRAVEILQEEAGKQFDPNLVPMFAGLVEEGRLKINDKVFHGEM